MLPDISVIGLGKLGAPMLAVFAEKGFNTIGVDSNQNTIDAINNHRAPVQEPQLQELLVRNKHRYKATGNMAEAIACSDVSFVIVPSPSLENGFFSNEFLIKALHELGTALREKQSYHLVVITSTVMPGSTESVLKETLEHSSGRQVGENLGLCYNPEFIALGSVINDMLNPDMILIGESDFKAGQTLEDIYKNTVGSAPEYQRMNFMNAEICKIAVNTFVTTKISYANMLAEMCDALPGAHVDTVSKALGADSRIGKKYLKGAVAYGGPCFPRDNKAFVAYGEQLGICTALASATDTVNQHQKRRLLEAVEAHAAKGKTVAVLGLSYKPNTPVSEESQGWQLAFALHEAGYQVLLHDPMALKNVDVQAVNSEFAKLDSLEELSSRSQCAVITTPWKEYFSLAAETAKTNYYIIDPWRCVERQPDGPTLIHLGESNSYRQAISIPLMESQ
ncbi:UDP-glucose dehydrogenase family protein [Polycladidibacter stylochi]|uniref:UDP-glucose dehydrogenase family protein n=1 Tax=Polycladidibacter stylochi TaxID=1807766 RepID=UPI000831E957|nr:nucleotide sugar dehydrogenase [Pseudovibrio stylochi]